jgi:hypothetical protein
MHQGNTVEPTYRSSKLAPWEIFSQIFGTTSQMQQGTISPLAVYFFRYQEVKHKRLPASEIDRCLGGTRGRSLIRGLARLS